jgi:hypothetical protein
MASKAIRKSNPNGANQHLFDPRQKLCWDLYINPKSETFANATQSAIKAGYVADYADQITTSEWFLVKLRKLNMVNKAEKNLDNALETNYIDIETGEIRSDVMRIVMDVSKTIVTTLGKDDGYSTRSEHTGKDGEKLVPVPLLSAIFDINGEEN